MGNQPLSSMTNPSIQLEIVAQDEQQQDLGDVAEVGQNMIDHLIKNGCTVTAAYTGRMGGPLYDIVIHAYHIIHSNEELLAAFFASLAAALKLISEHNKRREEKKGLLTPAPIPVEIDLPTKDGPLTIKAPNAETAEKMLEQFKDMQPDKVKKVNPQDKAKIKVSIPRQKWLRPH